MLSSLTIKEVGTRKKDSISMNELIVRFGDTVNINVLDMKFVTGCSVSDSTGEIVADIEKGG